MSPRRKVKKPRSTPHRPPITGFVPPSTPNDAGFVPPPANPRGVRFTPLTCRDETAFVPPPLNLNPDSADLVRLPGNGVGFAPFIPPPPPGFAPPAESVFPGPPPKLYSGPMPSRRDRYEIRIVFAGSNNIRAASTASEMLGTVVTKQEVIDLLFYAEDSAEAQEIFEMIHDLDFKNREVPS